MPKKLKFLILTLSMMIAPLGMPLVSAHAASCDQGTGFFSALKFPTWYKYVEFESSGKECRPSDLPTGDFSVVWKIGMALVEMVLRVAGMIGFGFVVYGGFKYVLSKGNAGEAAKARQTVIDALIGMTIAIIATAFVAFLGRYLTTGAP